MFKRKPVRLCSAKQKYVPVKQLYKSLISNYLIILLKVITTMVLSLGNHNDGANGCQVTQPGYNANIQDVELLSCLFTVSIVSCFTTYIISVIWLIVL